MAAGELANKKGLGVAAGTQRRHLKSYQEAIQRIRDGAIGELIYGRCYWNGGQIWVIPREKGWSDMEWQLRNWNYFTWLSGDHYLEQHVHNLDIMNWVIGDHPIRATSAVGGRQVRVGDIHGHIFDHFAVEFEYPNGVRMFSPSPADQWLRRPGRRGDRRHQWHEQLQDVDQAAAGRGVAVPRARFQRVSAGTPGSDRQHPRR